MVSDDSATGSHPEFPKFRPFERTTRPSDPPRNTAPETQPPTTTTKRKDATDAKISAAIRNAAARAAAWNNGYAAYTKAWAIDPKDANRQHTPAKLPTQSQELAEEFIAGWRCARSNYQTHGALIKRGYRWVTSKVYREIHGEVDQDELPF